MRRDHPSRFVVKPAATRRARWRYWLTLCSIWLASLVVVAGLAYFVTERSAQGPDEHAELVQLRHDNQVLKNQVTSLNQSLQVTRVATASLKDTLAQRGEKIAGLRADLAFYSHLIGGGAQHHGLRIDAVHLSRVGSTRAYNIVVTLTHNVKRGQVIKGAVKVAVEGIHGGHLTRLAWDKLSAKAQASGLPFSFRYFQQVRGTLMLPSGFTPNQVHVDAAPEKGSAAALSLAWKDALKSVETSYVQ